MNLRRLLNPQELHYRMLMKVSPSVLWNKLAEHSRKLGLQGIHFSLSFDCDLLEDCEVLPELDAKLERMGIRSSYAVPGEVLLHGVEKFEILKRRGREFLNHGHTLHTFWNADRNRHESCFFYDRIGWQAVEEDVRKGHETLSRFLGKAPSGFRTPHFGTFQKRRELRFLYRILEELGYRYSSSTVPYSGFKYGPAYPVSQSLLELPVSGVFSRPLHILDSWGFFDAPDRAHSPSDYVRETKDVLSYFGEKNQPAMINIYADPLGVVNQSAFWEAMQAFAANCTLTTMEESAKGIADRSMRISLR